MKHLRIILVFLLLGAIINIAVAWTIALTIDFVTIEKHITARELSPTSSWTVSKWEAFGSEQFISYRRKAPFPIGHPSVGSLLTMSDILPPWGDFDTISKDYADADHGVVDVWHVEGRGWPYRSMWGTYGLLTEAALQTYTISSEGRRGMLVTDVPAWKTTGMPRLIPMIPIWSGFAANTSCYAFMLWLPYALSCFLCRVVRRLRGRCPRCGYDLRGAAHAACPECGHVLPRVEPT